MSCYFVTAIYFEKYFFPWFDLTYLTHTQLFLSQVPLHRLYALSQDRLPSAIASVFVECLADINETCQDHLRMTLKYGNVSRRILIPIWVNLIHFISQFS